MAADITTFPTITTRVRVNGCNAIPLEAAEAITAGMVVCLDNDGKLVPGDSDDGYMPIGVADTDIASGAVGTVNTAGTICYVANENDTTAIGEGAVLIVADADVGGTVLAQAGGGTADEYIIGLALTDITGNGCGLCLVNPAISNTD